MNNALNNPDEKSSGYATDLFWWSSARKCSMAVGGNDSTVLVLFSE